ncbi:dienelactone hydrolase family protein [Agriterribacter sp.]|uniref:carboxylesterase family protein n=1 Tax=Agriterribacter sp. TaxID=2821509 RepID=UPI002CF82DF4|nr:dienelactone hydrolase family protein [Agriterribacter sp.]HTN08188.1 dienelactone hydrolase family protein [Agriterribacter sp.]
MKKTIVKLLCFAIVLLTLFSCKKETAEPEKEGDENAGTSLTTPTTKPDIDVAETMPPIQTPITSNITSNCNGYYKALPARYDSTTKKYPVIIFLHGQSALGNGSADNLKKISGGPYSLIKNKKFPASFTAGGKSFSFIVISPQFKTWPSGDDVDAVVNYFTSKLRVDPTRIYVTGLSMGGGATWDYAGKYASKIAAIAPVCGASSATEAKAKMIANNKLPVWAFHNDGDDRVSVDHTLGYINMLNNMDMKPKAKMTIYAATGHDAWTKAYSLTYKEDDMNVYEWMLQYHR